MSCRKLREQAGGVGCSDAKVGNAGKVDEDDDAMGDEEEDEWTEDEDEETDEI